MTQSSIARLARTHRAGTVYVAVMGVALIVGVIGLASLHVARLELAEMESLDNMARARLAARSGVECALAKIKSDILWRTLYTSGVTNILSDLSNALSPGDTFTFSFIDSDGSLNDNAEDPVTIRSVGQSGDARHVIEVLLQPKGQGVGSLSASVHSGGNMQIRTTFTTNQTVSSNSSISIEGGSSNIVGNAQAVGSIVGNVSGSRISGMNPPLEMPDTANVLEYYVSNGTPILASQLSGDRIDKTLLSSSRNPYGTQVTNAQGIYVIDCQGRAVKVRDSRIRGTLVFLNVGDRVELEGSINWEPVIANFPAMIVDGNLRMKWNSQNNLPESTAGFSLNPSGSPYLGATDNDTDDSFPGVIEGLIYVTGDLEIQNKARTSGVTVVGGQIAGDSNWELTYDSIFYTDAPPGFGAGTDMELVPGSWTQVSY